MANLSTDVSYDVEGDVVLRIVSFEVAGLFGGTAISIDFPNSGSVDDAPSVMILAGRNGTGKTTILRMIDGMLKLDFDVFRKVPFISARLEFSNGSVLAVRNWPEPSFPILASFSEHSVKLPAKKGDRESPEHSVAIDYFRSIALPVLRQVSYQLIELDRTPIIDRLTEEEADILRRYFPHTKKFTNQTSVANRVADFVKDAQVNYRRFFRSEEFSYLPRILDRLSPSITPPDTSDLIDRLEKVKEQHASSRRYGLANDEDQVAILERLLRSSLYNSDQQLIIIETYIENLENAQRARNLIAQRLSNFERIMADFLIGKVVTIERRKLIIKSAEGVLDEQQLSSGEYHFLYMMVTALLCQRVGTVIAIDEPELSLHVSWQRRLISALIECASGASPTFLFATQSLVISAEHRNSVKTLSAID